MTKSYLEHLSDTQLDVVAGAGPASDGPDGPFIKTKTAQIDAGTVVDEIGARMRQGMDARTAAETVEQKHLP